MMLTMTEELETELYANRIEYVAGFLIDTSEEHVVVILKNRPAKLAGNYNGVGGKIELGESPLAAMRREFWEETGVVVQDWHDFLWYLGKETSIHFFSSFAPLETLQQVRSVTDEEVSVQRITELKTLPTLPNVSWVLPMALMVRRANPTGRYLVHEG